MSFASLKVIEKTHVVMDEDAIHFLGPDGPPVLATPTLVSWLEVASRENAAPLLKPGEDTVGISVAIKHLAPTPVGMRVRVVSKLRSVQGRIYSFDVEAYDEVEKVTAGAHERASVLVRKFAARLAAKKEAARREE